MTARLPYPPPYQDIATLGAHLCLSTDTIDKMVREGRLPPPKNRHGKRLWKWSEVEKYLDDPDREALADDLGNRIMEATRAAANAR